MMYLVEFFVVCLVISLVGVASNPSPYFGAGSLVVAASLGCGILVMLGSSFVSLVLLLIYLGGMLVVFAYSVALAADPFPESLGVVGGYFVGYVVLVLILVLMFGEAGFVNFGVNGVDSQGLSVVRVDLSGVSLLYSMGGWGLLICGWALLLALFVVLELTRGLMQGSLRAV
uniref:NADH-ubiquinone oxidoreductase chain 6 n=2 Tax=Darevskia TaxID=122330 RepID=A0A6B7FCI1_DARSA|nr:NADH dehydrogenase subunit 6 [Darevskia saxicola]YP_009910947.1 NADH dehydrogenase subunit 6 [Darevskia brauneri]QBA55859.1 NADH dehydrogenase subunit 6 [Darevskia saxicola]QDP70176.1 NADH dehydrogenase subunit 6 [Darevskia brauneri]